jgi:hypothetical protein
VVSACLTILRSWGSLEHQEKKNPEYSGVTHIQTEGPWNRNEHPTSVSRQIP